MAAREGQGLQIAVIIFAMLTIMLAITTYIFYAQSQTAAGERDAAVAKAQSTQAQNNKQTYQLLAFEHVMGGATEGQVKAAEAGAGGEDEKVAKLMDEFKSDMALIGTQAGEGAILNYRTMPVILLAALNKKNASVVDSNDQVNKAQAEKVAAEQRETARAEQAVAAAAKATADLAAEKETYTAARAQSSAIFDETKARVDAMAKKQGEDIKAVTDQRDQLQGTVGTIEKTVQDLKEKNAALALDRVNLFESPDGVVTSVSQRQGRVWISVGRADGLLRQTNFSVFDHDINGVANAKAKARLEVVRLSDDHLAECRILEDSPANPILPGDVVHTPTWSPGQRIHFAVAGFMDLDNDGRDDQERIRDLITLNGGVIDLYVTYDGKREGAITFNTRYLVMDDDDDDKRTAEGQTKVNQVKEEITKFSTEMITLQKLLNQMGWKADVRTQGLTGGAGGAFRSRQPGAARGAEAAEAPAAEPMPAGGAAPADPFRAPAPVADPFEAAPEPMPEAEAVVDPFATVEP
ncbi:MAG: hypothetical protein WD872_09225 [Pirellulaceae bacterium]